jgi:hypothetical protein
MRLPIGAVKVGIGNGISAMDHHGIAHIDSYMGNAGGVVCPREKHKVAGSDIGT